MLALFLVIFSLCLNFSKQDYLYNLALEQGLDQTEAKEILEYEKHDGIKRQAVLKSKSGIPQTKICGINGVSLNRRRRQDKRVEDTRPQGSIDWPWMALILTKDTNVYFCGGSLLNSRYVLTAAHCFVAKEAKDESKFYVRLGEYDTLKPDETEIQEFEVEKLIRHSEYDNSNKKNDIALLKLNRTVEYTRFVRPICLPSSEPPTGSITYVAGWGKTTYKGMKSHLLLDVDQSVLDHEECVEELLTNEVHDSNICAGSSEGGKDSCQGDSGGPLMYQRSKSKRWDVVGVTSWGRKCASGKPGVYTSVVKFLQWIGKRITDVAP